VIRCSNKAVWWMQGKDVFDFTLACNDHVEYMKWDDHFDTYPFEDLGDPIPCCWLYHTSDCAVHNEPAYSNGPCYCDMDDP